MMNLDRAELLKLLRLVSITRPEEIDCAELLHRAPGFVERFLTTGDPPSGYDDVLHHLRICPECLEELEALSAAMRSRE